MKISQTSINLLIVAVIFTALAISFNKRSDQITQTEVIKFELRKKEKEQKQLEKGEPLPSFFYDSYEAEMNYADFLCISFSVLTLSSILAAIKLRE